jgi:hypothetical protein
MYPRLRNLDGRGGRFSADSFSDDVGKFGDVVDHLVVPPFLRMMFSRSRMKKML